MTEETPLTLEQMQVTSRRLRQRIEMDQGPITLDALNAFIGHALIVHRSNVSAKELEGTIIDPEHSLEPDTFEIIAAHSLAVSSGQRKIAEIRESTLQELNNKSHLRKLARRLNGVLPKS